LNLLGDLHGNKVAVLGDMLELGQYEEQGHEMVGRRVAEVADILITVGKRGHIIASAARHAGMKPGKIFEFDNHDDAITHLQKSLSKEDVVLVKGSRNVHMDQIVNALEIPE
jgi:UDP-N-acetylmuramoyl-tripeptide--D-alanyl-D-alanine ligase